MNRIKYIRSFCMSFTGTKHKSNNTPCQDISMTFENESGVYIAVLCDGAGSCENAHIGANITANSAIQYISDNFFQLLECTETEREKRFVGYIQNALRRYSDDNCIQLESLSSTVLCTALHENGSYLWFHVGDGLIATRSRSGEYSVISNYFHKIAINVTSFITETPVQIKSGKGCGDYTSFLLMSDGPEQFLSLNGSLTQRAVLLLQIAHFFNERHMELEFDALTELLNEYGMSDDASYAILADKRSAADIIEEFTPEIRESVMLLPRNLPKSKIKGFQNFLRLLSECESADYKKAVKILHTHKISRMLNKLDTLIEAGIIRIYNGRFFF